VAGDSTFRSDTDRIRCDPSTAAVSELAGAALAIDRCDAGFAAAWRRATVADAVGAAVPASEEFAR
jgi:hypothetical protein